MSKKITAKCKNIPVTYTPDMTELNGIGSTQIAPTTVKTLGEKGFGEMAWDHFYSVTMEETFAQVQNGHKNTKNGKNNSNTMYFSWLTRQEKFFIFLSLSAWFIFIYNRN